MNDEFSLLESELTQLRPASLHPVQLRRLERQIAARLTENPVRRRESMFGFSWHWLLAWGAGAAMVALMMMTMTGRPSSLPVQGMKVASSNAWEVQIRSLESPKSSNVRENQFFESSLFSNLPSPAVRKI